MEGVVMARVIYFMKRLEIGRYAVLCKLYKYCIKIYLPIKKMYKPAFS